MSPARAAVAARIWRGRRRWGEAASGVRSAADNGAGDRAPTRRAPLHLWGHDLRHAAGQHYGAGAVRAADHRDHRLPYVGQFLSNKRTAHELFGTPVSEGTVT